MENKEFKQEIKDLKLGSSISPRLFKIDCKGCKNKFSGFAKYCINPDYIEWTCGNCNSKFKMFCLEYETKNENSQEISVFRDRNGVKDSKTFVLENNSAFREVLQ